MWQENLSDRSQRGPVFYFLYYSLSLFPFLSFHNAVNLLLVIPVETGIQAFSPPHPDPLPMGEGRDTILLQEKCDIIAIRAINFVILSGAMAESKDLFNRIRLCYMP